MGGSFGSRTTGCGGAEVPLLYSGREAKRLRGAMGASAVDPPGPLVYGAASVQYVRGRCASRAAVAPARREQIKRKWCD